MTVTKPTEIKKFISFTIKGEPKPKQGDRQFILNQNGRQRIAHYQPKQVVNEHANIKSQILAQLPPDFDLISNPITASVSFMFYPPQLIAKKMKKNDETYGVPKPTKPDLDNLEKMLWDAMEGVVFVNDSLIWYKDVSKTYSLTPGIYISLSWL